MELDMKLILNQTKFHNNNLCNKSDKIGDAGEVTFYEDNALADL
jgi:hypothetical protein